MRDISRAGGGVQGSQWKMTASVKLQTEAVGPRGEEDCHSLRSCIPICQSQSRQAR